MSVIEDLFKKFDKGELRLAERDVDLSSIDTSSGEILVTIDDLVSTEEAVAVLINLGTSDDPDYQPVDADAGADVVATGQAYASADDLSASSLEDNQVGVKLYDNTLSAIDTDESGSLKVIARGY